MACGLMKKGGVLNYNISLFLSLENNFGDLGGGGRAGIIVGLCFFKCWNNNQVDVFFCENV